MKKRLALVAGILIFSFLLSIPIAIIGWGAFSVEAAGYTKKDQPQNALHVQSTVGSNPRLIRWKGGSSEIWVQNLSAVTSILISFDSEINKKYWTIPSNSNGADVFPINTSSFHIKSGGAKAAFEIIVFKRGKS